MHFQYTYSPPTHHIFCFLPVTGSQSEKRLKRSLVTGDTAKSVKVFVPIRQRLWIAVIHMAFTHRRPISSSTSVYDLAQRTPCEMTANEIPRFSFATNVLELIGLIIEHRDKVTTRNNVESVLKYHRKQGIWSETHNPNKPCNSFLHSHLI